MISRPTRCLNPCLLLFLSLTTPVHSSEQQPSTEPDFPTTPEVFIDTLTASEGLTFNAQGQLFIGANNAIWRAEPDGRITKITDVITHLGQAGIGQRDILAADFGPTLALRHGPSTDGIIWRVTPAGEKTVAVRGIGDPNCILGREDGSYLVSDDFTNNIYLVDVDGTVSLFSDAVRYPNGLALSPDGGTLYVAQIFTGIAPVGFTDQLWALPLKDGKPAGAAQLVAETGGGGLDGLAMDERGRVYIADNGGGKIWRFDPDTEDLVLIAEGVPAAASLVFGEGEFDQEALYVTSGFRGGGTIWKIHVGVRGLRQHRIDPASGGEGHRIAAAFDFPTPIVLSLSGDFATRTTVRDGLAALHHFWYDEARTLFRRAQEADPAFALAYWGEAMSHYDILTGHGNLDGGREALAQLDAQAGEALASVGTEAERALIESVRLLFAEGPRAEQEQLYSQALGRARERLPNESEIAVLYALSLQGLARHGDSESLRIRSAAILEEMLRVVPMHPGVLHYLLHAYDHPLFAALDGRPRRLYSEVVSKASGHQPQHAHTSTHLQR